MLIRADRSMAAAHTSPATASRMPRDDARSGELMADSVSAGSGGTRSGRGHRATMTWDTPCEENRMDAQLIVPIPRNEPVRGHAPGSPERASLRTRLGELAGERIELTNT